LAGGFEIALACDLIVAADNAQFGLPEVKRGLIAGSGGLLRLPQRIPRQIAMQYALTGEMMSATEARQWGLVNLLTSSGEALHGAKTLAHKIAANAPLAVRASKHMVTDALHWPADERWQRQNALLETIIHSNDAKEGATAFSEKRLPLWTAS
jgi:enoyl-CoA hydratase